MLAYGETLERTGKQPLVVSGSIGAPSRECLDRPATEVDPALAGGDAYKGMGRSRKSAVRRSSPSVSQTGVTDSPMLTTDIMVV